MRDSKRSTQSSGSFQDNDSKWTKKVPLKYHEEKGEKRESVTFQVTIATEKIKESVEVYEEGNNEQLLRTVRDFKNFVDTHDLFAELKETSVYAKFRRVLKGDTKDSWDELINGETKSQTNFDTHLADLVTDEIGTEAFKYQVKYLRKTKKPKNVTLKCWMKRVRTLNSYLPLLKAGEKRLTEEYLLEEVILENIPARWQRECDLRDIDDSNNWSEVEAFLIKCEEQLGENQSHQSDKDQRTQPRTNSKSTQGKGKGKDNDKRDLENPCKLPNHEHHEWKDCFNNPRSDNFKGTAKTPKDFNSDGSAKKEKWWKLNCKGVTTLTPTLTKNSKCSK